MKVCIHFDHISATGSGTGTATVGLNIATANIKVS